MEAFLEPFVRNGPPDDILFFGRFISFERRAFDTMVETEVVIPGPLPDLVRHLPAGMDVLGVQPCQETALQRLPPFFYFSLPCTISGTQMHKRGPNAAADQGKLLVGVRRAVIGLIPISG